MGVSVLASLSRFAVHFFGWEVAGDARWHLLMVRWPESRVAAQVTYLVARRRTMKKMTRSRKPWKHSSPWRVACRTLQQGVRGPRLG